MTKALYFCVGCRQVHYDEDYNSKDGDLLIHDWVKFMESANRHNKVEKDKCNHTWVYSDELLLLNPPKKKKICSKCGLKETESIGYTHPSLEKYDDVVKRLDASGRKND